MVRRAQPCRERGFAPARPRYHGIARIPRPHNAHDIVACCHEAGESGALDSAAASDIGPSRFCECRLVPCGAGVSALRARWARCYAKSGQHASSLVGFRRKVRRTLGGLGRGRAKPWRVARLPVRLLLPRDGGSDYFALFHVSGCAAWRPKIFLKPLVGKTHGVVSKVILLMAELRIALMAFLAVVGRWPWDGFGVCRRS